MKLNPRVLRTLSLALVVLALGILAAVATAGAPLEVSVQAYVPAGCNGVRQVQPGAASGYYTVDPDGSGPNVPLEAFCDMETDGGGWTVIDPGHDASWQAHFSSWQLIDSDRAAVPNDPWASSPSYVAWVTWFLPAQDNTRFRISPLCREVSPTLSIAEAYVATGNFYGCTWYNDNCDMEPTAQECYRCLDDFNPFLQPGTCSHLALVAGKSDNIYDPYGARCVGDWWNRAPSIGLQGKWCVAYREPIRVWLPLVVKRPPA